MRTFFHIAYDGSNYRGWQRLPGVVSVQQTIEEALSKILKKEIQINGCGRTDTGVHASQYFFHAEIETVDFDLKYRLNKTLSDDIAVYDIIDMDDKAHARFDAFSRSYDYFIHSTKNPFLQPISSYYDLEGLDLNTMAAAVSLLPKYENYIAFCKTPEKHEHHICRISEAILYANSTKDQLRFNISSNRFLKGMIRIIISKLLEIGKGNLSLADFEESLKNGKILPETKKAYPRGLYLTKVEYRHPQLRSLPAYSPVLLGGEWIPIDTKK